ncbi:MAG: phage major capsid protein [Desulfovibrio sp.]|jgi:HK97 family phage major capsid protein|nr:phage major capsid protein [Desulfovibrio sp.]
MYQIASIGLTPLQANIGWNFPIFADVPKTIEEIQEQMVSLTNQVVALQAQADAEGRGLTPEEKKMREELMNEFDVAERELLARQRLAEQEDRLAASAGRKTPAMQPGAEPVENSLPAEPKAAPVPRTPVAHVEVLEKPSFYATGGFRSLGEIAIALYNEKADKGTDKRLIALRNAAYTGSYGSEGVGADGGVAVPPDFRAEIMQKIFGEESLVSKTDQQTTESKSMTFPMDETTPWDNSGGIQGNWVAEGNSIPESKPKLDSQEVKLFKYAILAHLTDELLEDAPAMTRYLNSKVPQKFNFALTKAIINGSGTGAPLGILGSPALITVDGEEDQPADTVNAMNLIKMRSAMYSAGKVNGLWLANPLVEEQLMLLTFPGSTSQPVPIYMPPNGFAGRPYGTIFGNPVMFTEACADTGDVGDILYVDPSQYMTLTRRGYGLRQDTSIHMLFAYDMESFRFILRFGGMPWWKSKIAGGTANRSYSAFVALAERPGPEE